MTPALEVGPTPTIDPATLDWDDEAREVAIEEARLLQESDPEGAAQLLAQVDASLRYEQHLGRETGVVPASSTQSWVYDPTELIEFGMYYWHIDPFTIKRIDYREFFAYIRQAVLRLEAEQAEMDRARAGHPHRTVASSPTEAESPEGVMGGGMYQPTHVYSGEVVPYQGR